LNSEPFELSNEFNSVNENRMNTCTIEDDLPRPSRIFTPEMSWQEFPLVEFTGAIVELAPPQHPTLRPHRRLYGDLSCSTIVVKQGSVDLDVLDVFNVLRCVATRCCVDFHH